MKLSDLTAKPETFSPIHPDQGVIEDVKLTLASPFSREYNAATARLHSELLGDESEFDFQVGWEIMQAEAVLIGWSGIEANDDTPIEFTKEEASKLLRNPEHFWIVSSINEHLSKKKGYLQTLTNRLKSTLK